IQAVRNAALREQRGKLLRCTARQCQRMQQDEHPRGQRQQKRDDRRVLFEHKRQDERKQDQPAGCNKPVQNPNTRFIISNRSLISCTISISTTMRPASVVISACSSRPERDSSCPSTATRIPTAAMRKIRSTSIGSSAFRSAP